MANGHQPISDPAVAEFAGEVRAQLKELIHDRNASAATGAAIARSLAKLEDMPRQLEKLEKSGTEWLQKLDSRLDALETDKVRRDQTTNLGILILKSPALRWIALTLALVWAFITEKINIQS